MAKPKFKQLDNIICIAPCGDFEQGDVTQVEHENCKGCGGYLLEGSRHHYRPDHIELCFDLFKPAAHIPPAKPDTALLHNFFTSMSKMLAFSSINGTVPVDHVTGVMKPYLKEFGIEFDFFDLRPPIDQDKKNSG